MNAWVIIVKYLNGQTNVSQDAYESLIDAIKEINYKLENVNFTAINDFIFKDLDNNILYELKCIYIRKSES